MGSAANNSMAPSTSSIVELQSTSFDIWQTKYQLTAKDGSKVDKNIDETYDQGTAIRDQLDSEKLDSDDPAVQERYQHFQDVADQSAAAMDADPLSFTKQNSIY
jgi:hypothetical protein